MRGKGRIWPPQDKREEKRPAVRAGGGGRAWGPPRRHRRREGQRGRQEPRGQSAAGGDAVQPMGWCPGLLPVPTQLPATYFPWRRRSGGGRRGSQPAGAAVGAVGRQHQAAAGAAVVAAARHWACCHRCAWCPLRWVMPGRAREGIARCRGATCRHTARGQGSPPHCAPFAGGQAAQPHRAPGACSSHRCSAACRSSSTAWWSRRGAGPRGCSRGMSAATGSAAQRGRAWQ